MREDLMTVHLVIPEDLKNAALEYLRKYGDGRSEAYDDLAQLLTNVRLEEREECAQTCDRVHPPAWQRARGCAWEIRNRPRT